MTEQIEFRNVIHCKQKSSQLVLQILFDILYILMILYVSGWSIVVGIVFLCIWITGKILSWLVYRATFTFSEDGISITSFSQHIYINWNDITLVKEVRSVFFGSRSHIIIVSAQFPKRQYIAGLLLGSLHPAFAIWKFHHTHYFSARDLLIDKVDHKYEVKK